MTTTNRLRNPRYGKRRRKSSRCRKRLEVAVILLGVVVILQFAMLLQYNDDPHHINYRIATDADGRTRDVDKTTADEFYFYNKGGKLQMLHPFEEGVDRPIHSSALKNNMIRNWGLKGSSSRRKKGIEQPLRPEENSVATSSELLIKKEKDQRQHDVNSNTTGSEKRHPITNTNMSSGEIETPQVNKESNKTQLNTTASNIGNVTASSPTEAKLTRGNLSNPFSVKQMNSTVTNSQSKPPLREEPASSSMFENNWLYKWVNKLFSSSNNPDDSTEKNSDVQLEEFSNFKDTTKELSGNKNIAVFWHIPRTETSSVKEIIGTCHYKIWASNVGIMEGHEKDTELKIVHPKNLGGVGVVNVDTTTPQGILRAKSLGFADSNFVDAVYTSFLHEANDLFSPSSNARVFTIFRHPVERAASMFDHLQIASWEKTYRPELQNWTLLDYAKSDIIENNWMVRMLSNKMTGEISVRHYNTAKEVVRRKMLIGLPSQMEETMNRFEEFFGWTYRVNPTNQEACRQRLLLEAAGNLNRSTTEMPDPRSKTYEALLWQNKYDLQLFEYAEELFKEQGKWLVRKDYRNTNSTCCECDPPTYPHKEYVCPPMKQIPKEVKATSGDQNEHTTQDTNSTLLNQLINFKETSEEASANRDVIAFWHIPKAGGSSIKDIIGSCHHKVWASNVGIMGGHDKDTTLAVVYPKDLGGAGFVNVDTTTPSGIMRAKSMGFANSSLADGVVVLRVYHSKDLFSRSSPGRLFTVFRHPIERAVSMFYYLQIASWEKTYRPELKNWTLLDYAKSDIIENNWMVRMLSNKMSGRISDEHYQIAEDVIRHKFLVGLLSQMEETMNRIEEFFHWSYRVNPKRQELCRQRLIEGGSNRNHNSTVLPNPGGSVYKALLQQNQYDLKLFEYAKQLFEEQRTLFVAKDYRNVNSTCCECDPPTLPYKGFLCPKVPVD